MPKQPGPTRSWISDACRLRLLDLLKPKGKIYCAKTRACRKALGVWKPTGKQHARATHPYLVKQIHYQHPLCQEIFNLNGTIKCRVVVVWKHGKTIRTNQSIFTLHPALTPVQKMINIYREMDGGMFLERWLLHLIPELINARCGKADVRGILQDRIFIRLYLCFVMRLKYLFFSVLEELSQEAWFGRFLPRTGNRGRGRWEAAVSLRICRDRGHHRKCNQET